LPIYGTEIIVYKCPHLDEDVELNLHFFKPGNKEKKYISFSCIKKFECGVYLWREYHSGNYDWSRCPAINEFKIGADNT